MIIDLQRKLMEIGRLRIGQQVATSNGKTRPAKLDTWRFTSANETVIRQAATLYGGTSQPWQAPSGPQWELISEATTLAVLVPPADLAFTQWYEMWSTGGCTRRCDGATETITDAPCLCDPDNRECKIHSRLSVLLSNLAGLGVWRVETSGWYAARELSAAVDVIRLAASSGQMLPAQLRLEQRMVKREGQTRRFAVPVLDIEVSPAQLLAGSTSSTSMLAITEPDKGLATYPNYTVEFKDGHPVGPLTPVPASVPEHPTASIAEQASKTRERKPRKGAAQPIPATGIKPRTAKEALAREGFATTADAPEVLTPPIQRAEEAAPRDFSEPQTPPEPKQISLDEPDLITPPQLTKLAILLKEAGFNDRETKLAFCVAAINRDITTSKELTKDEASHLIDVLENNEPPEDVM